jgi:hypothetical protein
MAARLADAEAPIAEPGIQAKAGAQAEASAQATGPDAPQTVPERVHTEPDVKAAGPEEARTGQVVRVAAWRRVSVRALSLGAAAAVASGVGVAVWVSQPAPTALAYTIPLHAAHGGIASGQAHVPGPDRLVHPADRVRAQRPRFGPLRRMLVRRPR